MKARAPLIGFASLIWCSLTALNRGLYAAGLRRARRLDARVISVGNLQAGGSGKTPLVAWIARESLARGQWVCILARGYRGRWELDGGVIRPGAVTIDPELCGDEPALLHSLVPEAWIGVGRDRAAQYEKIKRLASAETGAAYRPPLVILDDGFQHLRLARDLDVVALTSEGPFEILYRDRPRALVRTPASPARLAIWTKGERRPPGAQAKVRLALPPAPSGLRDVQPVWLVSGTAGPGQVLAAARAAGYRVIRHLEFPDHARYRAKLIESILQGARAAGARLALTGKDWVKWQRLGVTTTEVIVLEPALEWQEGRELGEGLLWG